MASRRVILLFNPVSGSGRAAWIAEESRRFLASLGHDVVAAATRRGAPEEWLPPLVADREVVVVVGGDGAVHMALGVLAHSQAAVWHAAAGTENLFARAFGMAPSPQLLAAAIDRFRTSSLDLGTIAVADGDAARVEAAPTRFAIMASTGFDAAVVHDLTSRRGGSISHWSYVPAILRQLRRWRAPEVTIALDDQPEQRLGRGVLIIGNLGEYGFRIDPVRRAEGSDGFLDGVFLSATGGLSALSWWPRFRLTRTILNRELVGLPRFRCRRIRVTTSDAAPWQADGDPVGQAFSAAQIGIQPAALRLLLPPG